MSFLEICNFSIFTFSPVHIGCGEDYEPTNYVIDNNRLYEFDPVSLMRHLSENDRDEFARVVENGSREIQSFFYRHKAKAVEFGKRRADVMPAVQKFYDSRVGQVAQREGGGRNVLNKLEIARTAFNPTDGLPILPGSSIKGAIRTALLNEKMSDNRYPLNTRDRAGNSLRERDIKRESSQQNQRMTQEILHLSNDNKLRFATDPFRFLKISDAVFRPLFKKKGADGTVTEIERCTTIHFQVNRKKKPNSFDAGGNINTLLECIPSNTPQAFLAQCVIEKKAGPGGKRPDVQLDFTKIANACNDFYVDRFNAEKNILRANKYAATWLQGMEHNLEMEVIRKSMKEGTGFLLRIGRHSGAESVTVDAPRCIKIMKGGGQLPEWAQATTTLWLAAEDKNQTENLRPFGWVFVKRN